MILDLVPATDPILRTATLKFNFSNPPANPVEIYNNLAETMNHHHGLGLSANQVGLPYRAFVIRSDPVRAFFNPIIVDQSEAEIVLDEACLSFPNIFLKISRPKRIRIRYADPLGDVKTEGFEGMTARILQHEMDHLNGIVFGQNVSRYQLERAIRKAKKHGHTYTILDLR